MMPAGKYYVGDLCYVMTDAEWEEVCNLTILKDKLIDGEFELKDGRRFAIYSTTWGDGTYHDQYGYSYSVDSGTIGCIRMEDIRDEEHIENILDLGAIYDFDNTFVTGGGRIDPDWDGIIQFGHVMIETDPSMEEEYE